MNIIFFIIIVAETLFFLSFLFFIIIIGIAFPTTVSINNCVAHFSPLPSDPEAKTALKEGDVVKM